MWWGRGTLSQTPFWIWEIQNLAAGETHTQVRQWLATEGIQISKNAFSKRCVAWETSRRTKTPATDPALVSAIDTDFHTTHHDDDIIARTITA